LRQLEYSQRLRDRARNVISRDAVSSTGRVLFEGALRGGARSLGVMPAQTGIAVGAPADFVSLDVASTTLMERRGDALLDSLVFAGPRGVDGVWRAGVKLVAEGKHRARDAIAARFRRALQRVLQP
jgi:cytosine/adenosine deaminase-related metal-dependent hydrolase